VAPAAAPGEAAEAAEAKPEGKGKPADSEKKE
jgi:hypothetical protein